ncbi:PLP-dependent aminotransferase family protein [Nocardioides nanhaiensis]|uniref:PLP-dependent aminotransferase family protein n=1 Tax=Nocardioides nanhaiensis TaxID=1476871 RepID=A0ABP8WWG9_9ACTN
MPTLPLTLQRGAAPLTAQLADQVRELCASGALSAGHRMPSTRALAAELGVSRSVVEQAYDQLVAEAWLEGRRGAGTFVAATAGIRPRSSGPGAPPRSARTAPAGPVVRLDAGTPWIDPRHAAGWRRAWREVSTATAPRGYDDPRGLPALRVALADRLARTRGLVVDPEELVVTCGTTDGLRHLLGAVPPGPVGVEDPGYRAAVETARAQGRPVRDLPATLPLGEEQLHGLSAVYTTPAHQHPLGRVMGAAERTTLLGAAATTGAVVVEDDYDSEFRYDVAPVPALAALDREHVAYLGTAAKSVAPSLRLGWLVPPPALGPAVERRRAITHDAAPWPVQRAFLALLREGYLDRVVRSARRVYAERAPRVAAALAPHAEAAGPSAGMYSTWLMPHDRAVAARESALAGGYQVNLLADYCRSSPLTGLVVGFGGVTDTELDTALALLVRGLEQAQAPKSR